MFGHFVRGPRVALMAPVGLIAFALAAYPTPGFGEDIQQTMIRMVAEAGQVLYSEGVTLIPVETALDRAEWIDGKLYLDLTVTPSEGPWIVGLHQMEKIGEFFAHPFMADPDFGGTVLRARGSAEGDYRCLEDFVAFNAPPPPPDAAIANAPPEVESDESTSTGDDAVTRGPVTQSTRQPTGALSGVVVYCTGGHGWTAGTSAWGLQRPVLLTMNEDYGNLDQLNYFVHYAYNAGATVVPFRPVGYQDIEIVLDNDDAGVTYTGVWVNATFPVKYYEDGDVVSGIPYREAARSASETATARYTPNITVTGFYPVYCFVESDADRCPQIYRVKHSGGVSEVAVDHRRVGNGWVWLGEYYLESEGESYVEITNEASVGGVVVADAIRWGNGIGDIVRPGPNTVSGFGRDEECQRYWAHGELGNNSVGFSAAQIWDSTDTDTNDNVSAAGRWGREMNFTAFNNDRWRRVYLEFHSNAATGTARGTLALVSNSLPTTNQALYAQILGDEVEADLALAAADFEHPWGLRSPNSLSGAFGAISTNANSNEYDATILEVAFHDNQMDAELMRDSRVRAALARASVHGLIRFLNSLAGSQVPIAFSPDTPRNVQVVDACGGDVTLSWTAPLSDGARGDPATGYAVYESTNGYGFTLAATLGNVLTTTLSGVPESQTRYYRIAATNAGGESMPSEVIAVRRPTTGQATVLIVNGFDRLRRQQNPTENVGGVIERQLWRRSNSFDYAVQHAESLAATGAGFDSCANEAVIAGQVVLGDYDIVVWILGEESSQDDTFDATEQSLVTTYLNGGGNLFLSGAEVAWDLDQLDNGRAFYESMLGGNYVGDDASTFGVSGTAGGIFADVGAFDFDSASGAPYVVDFPDQLAPQAGGQAALTYIGGSGGTAAVTFDSGTYRVVNLGFPFETITSAVRRAEIMQRGVDYLGGVQLPTPFDADDDGDVDLADLQAFAGCLTGPEQDYPPCDACAIDDIDDDRDVDLADFAGFQLAFTD